LLTYGAIVSQRRAFLGKSFLVVWWGFLIVAFAAVFVSWLLSSALSGTLIETRAGVFQFLLTFALYPVMTTLLASVQRLIPEAVPK
jgi:rod shape-determining protein MreD